MRYFISLLAFMFLLILASAQEKDDKKTSDQIKIEKNGALVKADGTLQDADSKPWVAVHDFTIDTSLTEWGLNGWDIAEKMENELVQRGYYRMVTRAKIAKVLKEQKVSTSGALEPSKFGAMVGAEFIITGQIDRKGNRLTIIAKLIDARKETGEIEKSFDISMKAAEDKESLAGLQKLIEKLSVKLSMSPGDFLDYGMIKLKEGNYEEAAESFHEVQRMVPLDEIKKLIEKSGDARTELPASLVRSGALLDYGMAEMKKGNNKEAVSAFLKIKESGTSTEIKNFLELHEAVKKVDAILKEKQDKLKAILAEADRLFLQAKANQDKAESEMPPNELCDKALSMLSDTVSDPKSFIGEDTRMEIEDMINKIKAFKGNIAGGPVPNKKWTVPDLKMLFMPIAPGTFMMGSESASNEDDNKEHNATITKNFWIGQCEVTIAQYLFYLQNPINDANEPKKADKDKEIAWTNDYCPITKEYKMKSGSNEFCGDENQPIIAITWKGADLFCKWLTKREQLAKRLPQGYEYRLPSEAEWEYTCRAVATPPDGKLPESHAYSFGDEPGMLADFAWYKANSGGKTYPVGQKKPNAWGLKDMHGNVWEWCYDWYDGAYLDLTVKDPKGSDASADNLKVLRGGSFMSDTPDLLCAKRYSMDYKVTKKNIGFRIVCGPKL